MQYLKKIRKISRQFLYVLLVLVYQSNDRCDDVRLEISASKATVLIFDDVIDEIELGSSGYVSKIKGTFLLIRAKSLKASPTFLFVRYGQGKKFCNIEICASNGAPLEYRMSSILKTGAELLGGEVTGKSGGKANKVTSFFMRKGQSYYTYSKKDYGVRITLLDIEHYNGNTYLKFYVKNNSSIDMDMDYISFNYYDTTRYFLLFSRRVKSRVVEPILPLPVVHVGSMQGSEFVFCIPTISVNGGLEVCFGEANEGRTITMNIPGKVLLKAKRRL